MFHKRNKFSLNPIPSLLANLFHGLTFFAFDPNDPSDMEKVQKMIDDAVKPLKEKRDQLLAELKTARKGAEIKPEDFDRVEQENEALKAQLSDAQKALKAANKTAEDVTKALQGEQGYTQKLLVENGLNAALVEAGVKNPVHLKAAAALIRASSKIEVITDGDNRVAKVGDKDLSAFVKDWSSSDEGKTFISAPSNAGGGAPGSNSQHKQGGNLGGSKEERTSAIAARFPELN